MRQKDNSLSTNINHQIKFVLCSIVVYIKQTLQFTSGFTYNFQKHLCIKVLVLMENPKIFGTPIICGKSVSEFYYDDLDKQKLEIARRSLADSLVKVFL